jgi:TonB family protein
MEIITTLLCKTLYAHDGNYKDYTLTEKIKLNLKKYFSTNIKRLSLLISISCYFTAHTNAQVDTTASIKNATNTAEVVASFPGGQKALTDFLTSNLVYPLKAINNDISGQVVVEFVVCEDGTVCNTKVVKGTNLLNEESLRVVRAMPKWTPGSIKGKPVSSYFSLPITYNLMESKSARQERREARRTAKKNKLVQ